MTGTLVRMRLAVLRRSLSGGRAAGVALGLVLGLGLAAVTWWAALVDATGGLVAIVLLVWAVGWAVGPMTPIGRDESMRPEHFALLPIPPRRLARGLLVTKGVGVGPLVTLLGLAALVGLGIGTGSVTAALVAVPAAVLQLAVVVLVAVVLDATIGSAMGSRRGEVFGLALVVLLCAAGFSLHYLVEGLVPALVEGRAAELSGVALALPSAWSAVAVTAAARGDVVLVVAPLAGLAVLAVLLVLAWGVLVERRLTTRTGHAGSRRTGGPPRRILPATPTGAAAGVEVRTWLRDGNRRIYAVASTAESAWLFVVPGLAGWVGASWLFWVTLRLTNAYGATDRPGAPGGDFWPVLVAPGAERADVRGRQLAFLLVAGPIALVLTAAPLVAGLSGVGDPTALAALVAALGGAAGLFPWISARLPFRLGTGGNGGSVTAALLTYVPAMLAVVAPGIAVSVVGRVLDVPALTWAGVAVGAVVGVAVALAGGAAAARRLAATGPEVLAAVRGRGRAGADRADARSVAEAYAASTPHGPAGIALQLLLWVGGGLVLVAQGIIPAVLELTGSATRAWFLARYLPDALAWIVIVVCVVAGSVAWVVAFRLDQAAKRARAARAEAAAEPVTVGV
ncbi:hypothetical protein WCD74_23295 [Actinomycetospora sp. OC33-EN08]|uniref:ABC-2 type transport system permease protein n=1 Tax=Actinomycetospora aurantiaca TaxID=3129233 RepID=A0ABU8MTS3_9PSEU